MTSVSGRGYSAVWKLGPKPASSSALLVKRDQRVAILLVQARQRLNQIADVGSDAEVAQAADVDDDVPRHRYLYRNAAGVSLQAYRGNRSVRARTARRTWFTTSSLWMLSRTCAISSATSRISGSRNPRVVTAGLPKRIPLGLKGGF